MTISLIKPRAIARSDQGTPTAASKRPGAPLEHHHRVSGLVQREIERRRSRPLE